MGPAVSRRLEPFSNGMSESRGTRRKREGTNAHPFFLCLLFATLACTGSESRVEKKRFDRELQQVSQEVSSERQQGAAGLDEGRRDKVETLHEVSKKYQEFVA